MTTNEGGFMTEPGAGSLATHSNGKSRWKPVTMEVKLPSGNVALLRPLGFDLVLQQARIPDFLTPMIVKAFKGEDASDAFKLDEFVQAQEFFEFLDRLCVLAFVSPRIVPEPAGEDEIALTDLDFIDKQWVMNAMGQPPEWLATFRPKSSQDVRSSADGENGGSAAEQTVQAEEAPEA